MRTTNKKDTQVRVAPYLRASRDRYGTEKSVGDQEIDYKSSLANNADWAEVAVFRDNNRSASRFATKTREDFVKLVEAIDAGEIDLLWIWEFSRSQRRLKVFADLAELCRERGVKWFVFTAGRAFDLDNASDRLYLGISALIAEQESEALSERTRRGVRYNLRERRPHGRPPYGYLRRYHPVTRAFVEQVADPVTGPVVTEIGRRFAAGEATNAIAVDLNKRGVVAPDGGEWTLWSVKRIALNQTYTGVRTYTRGKQRTPDGSPMPTVHEGSWPALIDQETYEQCALRATAPADRRWTRPSRPKHLLSNVAVCGQCGGPIGPQLRRDRRRPNIAPVLVYTCRNGGHVNMKMADADAVVLAAIAEWLGRADVWSSTMVAASDRSRAAHSEAAAARTELAEALALVKAGKLSVASLAEVEPALRQRIEDAEARATRASLPGPVAALVRSKGTASERFNALDLGARRAVLDAVCVIELLPTGRGRRFTPDRVRLTYTLGQ